MIVAKDEREVGRKRKIKKEGENENERKGLKGRKTGRWDGKRKIKTKK